METTSQSRAGDLTGDIAVVLITIAQLIFFVYYSRFISWPVTAPDGTVTRISLLTDNYSAWLRFPIVASVTVVVASIIVMVSGSEPIRHAAGMVFSILGLTVVVSALVLAPFDFSVLPNPTAARIVPKVVNGIFVFMALFYSVSTVLQFRKLLSSLR
jgi:bacteriorhodopsin